MKTIPLSKGYAAIVDDEDFDVLSRWRWHATVSRTTIYARRMEPGPRGVVRRGIFVHDEIARPPAGYEIDHINGDGLDNRRANLRIATRSQNHANQRPRLGPKSSRFKGVAWDSYGGRQPGRWRAHFQKRHLGTFLNEEDAARAYDAAAREGFGEFARCNFTEHGEPDYPGQFEETPVHE
jgi:hypothetical protein